MVSDAALQQDERSVPERNVFPLRDDFDRDVWCVLGLPFDRETIASAAEKISAAAAARRRLSFVTPNTNWLVMAWREPEMRRQIVDADLSLADGAPIVWLARRLGAPLPERVAGADVFAALRARPAALGRRLRVFFLGGMKGAAEAASAALAATTSGVTPAGGLDPGCGSVVALSTPTILDAVNAANADFVVVALGARKGQAWISHNGAKLTAPVVAHLGAVVDFVAGGVRRAPASVSRLGFEWAWRIKEDGRLWRRYLGDGAALVGHLLTRVVPALIAARGLSRHGAGTLRVENAADRVILVGDGHLGTAALSAARRAFRAAAAAGQPIILDLQRVTGCGADMLGLILMLEKAARQGGVALTTRGASVALKRLFALNGMTYEDVGEAVVAATGRARAA